MSAPITSRVAGALRLAAAPGSSIVPRSAASAARSAPATRPQVSTKSDRVPAQRPWRPFFIRGAQADLGRHDAANSILPQMANQPRSIFYAVQSLRSAGDD